MNSPSSGQHTAHYSPVIIATFVDQFIALARWRPCAFFLDGSGAAEHYLPHPALTLKQQAETIVGGIFSDNLDQLLFLLTQFQPLRRSIVKNRWSLLHGLALPA